MKKGIYDNTIFKVWEINDKNGSAEVKCSTSRKVDENNEYDRVQIEHGVAKNGYINTYYYMKFVKQAYEQLKNVKPGDAIVNLRFVSSREMYWSSENDCIKYPTYDKETIFSFEMYNPENRQQSQVRNMDKAPAVAESAPQVAPVQAPTAPVQPATPAQPVAPATPAPTADDECPF